jgi:hypothetical protein
LAKFTSQITRHGGQGVLALLDFPRADEVCRAQRLGVTVLGKPWRASELVAEVTRIASAERMVRIAA